MSGPALRAIDPALVARMRSRMVDEGGGPQRLFGISYNTWVKVRAGDPIRRSVADRLEHRLSVPAPVASAARRSAVL